MLFRGALEVTPTDRGALVKSLTFGFWIFRIGADGVAIQLDPAGRRGGHLAPL